MSRPVISEFFEEKFVQKVLSRGNSENTAERYLTEISKFDDWLSKDRESDLHEATISDIRIRLEELATPSRDRGPYSGSTIKRKRAALSQFFQLGREVCEDYEMDFSIEGNPAVELNQSWSTETKKSQSEEIKSRGGIYYLESSDIRKLVDNVPAPKTRNSLIVKILYNCGLRRGELASIHLDNLDRNSQTINIPAIKSKEPRKVTYSPMYVGFMLDEWLDAGYRDAVFYAREHDSDYLFPTDTREHISGKQVNQIVTQAAENAGLQEDTHEYSDGRQGHKISAHVLRHSYAVQAIKSGINLRSLQKLMGHEDLSNTEIYLKIAEEDYVEESRKFSI
ncbi:tyrosine-type recombinase/integrase [Halobacteriaceae archaeon SHR40]|uniref:tyrosine-type recombinase/integrase n=1 Tax=Halovenus amylolytica TaxID=2500550 RepID=UPI000FE35945